MNTSMRIRLILLIFGIVLIAGCGGSGSSSGSSGPESFTKTIGPEGGTVTDPAGGEVIIPAGALGADTAISITTYDAADMQRAFALAPFSSCVTFEPDGTVFAVPVTVVLPSAGISPGASYPVYVYDPAAKAWVQHENAGIGGANGAAIELQTSHFSTYAGFGSSGSGMNSFGTELGTSGNLNTAYDALQSSFEGMIGMSAGWNGKTYSVTGLLFDVQYKYDGVEGTFHDLVGDMALTTTKLSLSYDYRLRPESDPLAVHQTVFEIQITIYWKEVDENPADRTYRVRADAAWDNLSNLSDEIEYPITPLYRVFIEHYTLSVEFVITVKHYRNWEEYSFGYTSYEPWIPATLTQSASGASVTPLMFYDAGLVTDLVCESPLNTAATGEVTYGIGGGYDRLLFQIHRDELDLPGTGETMLEVFFDLYITGNLISSDYWGSSRIGIIEPVELFDGNIAALPVFIDSGGKDSTATITVSEIK